MKRTLSLILSLLMVLSLFTGLNVGAGARVSELADTGADAEIANTGTQVEILHSVDIINVTLPKPGESPVYGASVPSGAHYRISDKSDDERLNGVRWLKGSLNNQSSLKKMSPTDSFVDGETYTVSILVEPESDQYRFPTPFEEETLSSTINGGKSIVSWPVLDDGTDEINVDKLHVVVKWSFICHYDLCLGSTVVTEANKNDILGDGGKAKFDPMTHTLTLNDPVIPGVYERREEGISYKIFSSIPLTIKGKYHMTKAESDYGIYAEAFSNAAITITINGDVTVYGNTCGIYGYNSNITLNGNVTSYGKYGSGICTYSASLNIIGGSADISGYGYGIYGALDISENVESVTAEGTVGAVKSYGGNIKNIGNQNVKIIEPIDAIVKKSDDDYYYVYESDGTTIAKRAVLSSHAPISSVSVTDVVAPMPGAFVDTSCTIPSGCGYKTRYNYYDGVTWYTEEGDILSHGVDKFVGGKKYTAQIALTALDGYVFSDSATGTINGTNARVRVDNQRKTLYVNLTFTCPKAITAADCAVTDPVAGEKPNYTAVSGNSDKYSAEIINWFKGSGDRAVQMASRESFEAGNTYSVRVRYTAQDGYVFDENTVYTVNGQSTTYLGRGIYETSFTVINPNQPKPLASVSCTVTKPIAGQKPDNIAVPADSTKYSATVGSWIYGTGRTARTMSDDEEFIEGKSYQVQVKFTANRGYYLTDDTFCIINGKAATKVTIRGVDYYVVTFTAEAATTAISEFSVTNIMEPVAGQSPYYYAAVPAGKGYLVDEDFTDGTWVNGVLWHNDTDNKDMTENDTFEADKQYTATVLLDSAAGYSFASNVSGTLNGENAEVISYGNSTIGVYRTFTCQTTAILGDVDGDSAVTIIDATYIQRHLASIPIPFVLDEAIADTDEDGLVSIMDATYIQRWLAHLKSNDHIGQPM